LVGVVDIDRIAAAAGIARQPPGLPLFRRGIVAPDLARVPEADQKHALGIRPDAARAGAFLRRLDDGDVTVALVDLAEVVAAQRDVPDVVRRGNGDAVGTAARRFPALVFAGLGIDVAVHAILAGEPVDAVLVDR